MQVTENKSNAPNIVYLYFEVKFMKSIQLKNG
jgi:hypothetical protein